MPRKPHDIADCTMRLLLAEGVGPITLRKLRERFGADEKVAAASIAELAEIQGIGRETAQSICRAIDTSEPEKERAAMSAAGAAMVLESDSDYPALLKTIADPPAALWVRGTLKDVDRLAIAIVGSRKCSGYGREQAGRFASLLAQSGLTIVSGGALGVDGEAHRGALRVNGRTIVVLGCGLSTAYPPEHKELFDRIASGGAQASLGDGEVGGGAPACGGGGGGAVVSEFAMNVPPLATNFPRRNRVISGMSLGVLVVEAALRSGALITARLAAEEQHREVMALPGRVDSPASAGCLKAIREGWAALVTSHADVLAQLDSSHQLLRGALESAGHVDAGKAATLFDGTLSDGQRAIIEALDDVNEHLLIDQIAARTHLPVSQIMADLTLLQIRGRVVKEWSGGVRLKR